ncbi:MAG: hypothetical protein AB8B86_02830 [Pseudomonadales bacterium]
MLKYLERYAEAVARGVDSLSGSWNAAVTVPAYNEEPEDLLAIWQSLREHSCIFVLVLNQPVGESSVEPNQQCFDTFAQGRNADWQNTNQQLQLYKEGNSAVLLVDCFTEFRHIPAKQGVGLARKIGADIITALYHCGRLERPWIYSTDADAQLPSSYIDATQGLDSDVSILLLPFEHSSTGSKQLDQAQALYDLHLHYYVAGLAWANSPYAHQSMGSTQILNIEHYAKVRGYPKRNAGEDFYLLNKLSKTGRVLALEEPVVRLKTRVSNRTPFGTGAAVNDILGLTDPLEQYRYYHPQVFNELKSLLMLFPELWNDNTNTNTNTKLSTSSLHVLQTMGFEKAVEAARNNSKSPSAFTRHMHDWFDAFRTLKFIHGLRDTEYGSVSADKLLDLLPGSLDGIADQVASLLTKDS